MTGHIPIEDLSARVDDALPPARRDQVDAHLAVCQACRAEFASLAWTTDFVRAAPLAPLPAGRTLRVPVEEEPASEPPRAVVPGWWPRWGAWLSLGTIAALMLLAFALGRWMPPRSAMDAADRSGVVAEREAGGAAGESDGGAADGDAAAGAAETLPELPFDAQTAPEVAGDIVARGDDAERRTLPLATALTADRAAQRVEAGGEGVANLPAEASAGPEASPPDAVARAAPTAPAPAGAAPIEVTMAAASGSEPGGYAPPDAPIPGMRASAVRATGAPTATGLAKRIVAAAGTGEVAGTVVGGPAGSPQPAVVMQATAAPATGGDVAAPAPTLTVWAATNEAYRSLPAAAMTATVERQLALSDEVATGEVKGTPTVAVPPPSAGQPADGAAPPEGGVASPSLLVPVLGLSVGLMAIALLFMRQARGRARRRGER